MPELLIYPAAGEKSMAAQDLIYDRDKEAGGGEGIGGGGRLAVPQQRLREPYRNISAGGLWRDRVLHS